MAAAISALTEGMAVRAVPNVLFMVAVEAAMFVTGVIVVTVSSSGSSLSRPPKTLYML